MIWFGGATRRPVAARVPPVKCRVIWYSACMTAKILKDVLERVETWPEAAQTELAQIALEIDAGLGTGAYHATPKELAGIDRGLKAARDGRVATEPARVSDHNSIRELNALSRNA